MLCLINRQGYLFQNKYANIAIFCKFYLPCYVPIVNDILYYASCVTLVLAVIYKTLSFLLLTIILYFGHNI